MSFHGPQTWGNIKDGIGFEVNKASYWIFSVEGVMGGEVLARV